jgi:hypothetical protein
MKIPSRNLAGFANDLIRQCSASMKMRAQRGLIFKNYFLTGSSDGNPAIFNKTYAYIDNLASYLYSPVDLRFVVQPYGRNASPADRAKAHAATDELNLAVDDSNTDTVIEQAVLWGLVKGKVFTRTLWNGKGLETEVIQPEAIGVLRDDIDSLDKQEAFFHRTWMTQSRFAELIENHPNRDALFRKAGRYLTGSSTASDNGDQGGMPVLLGGQAFSGAGPYTAAGPGGSPTGNTNQNVAFWLASPPPMLDPQVLATLIPFNELWVWNSEVDDWTTIQIVGEDILIEGDRVLRNLFADSLDPANKARKIRDNPENPLSERTPFREICANPVDGYMWGRSEVQNVGFLQESINARVNGINGLLRRQEDPPMLGTNITASAAQMNSRMRKPGGFMTEANPNASVKFIPPEIPEGLYLSVHENERMFDEMGGMPDVMRGHGDRGVRSHKQVETLTRNASPRFKDRALLIERQVAAIGSLCHRIQRAKVDRAIIAWMRPGAKSIEIAPLTDPTIEPPVEGMQGIEFMLHQVPDDWRVTVDGHSASPAFMYEEEQKAQLLAQQGAISKEMLINLLDPPHRDELAAEAMRAEIAAAQFAAEHPEAAQHGGKKKK